MNKQYWENVLKVRKNIYDTMKKLGVTAVMVEKCELYSNQISENGGIGLEFSYGFPDKIYTPLGYLHITSDCIFGNNQNELLIKLTEDYGLVEVEPKVKTIFGERGPVYSITRFPWSDEQIPIFERRKAFGDEERAEHYYWEKVRK